MTSRREFLRRIFAQLDAEQIPWCVLRNFDEVFASSGSDIDLMAQAKDVPRMLGVCRAVAQDSGHRLVQRTRFVNHSWVFWHPPDDPAASAGEFIRIDVDTEVRWRLFHVVSAHEVLRERQRSGEMNVPAPKHEREILRAQTAWRGVPTERYTCRLAALGAQPEAPSAMRRAIAARALMSPSGWARAMRYLCSDAARWWERRRNAPGARLLVLAAREFDHEKVLASLATLFPRGKSSVGGRIARSLFKGGLAISITRVPGDEHVATTFRRAARHWPECAFSARAGRTFILFAHQDGPSVAAHRQSGTTATLGSDHELGSFIATILATQNLAPRTRPPGACVVLAGLDGSGKTTFARNLCAEATAGGAFTGSRYFHWLPRLRGIDFPLPSTGDMPRRTVLSRKPLAIFASGLRLLRNVIRARLVFSLRIRPLVRRGYLVVLDRFLLNYWLDPASVRYSGPDRWLTQALRWMPQAEALIVLNADAATLLSRKGELTAEQIETQRERLRALPPIAQQRIDLDATEPPETLARGALARLASIHGHDR